MNKPFLLRTLLAVLAVSVCAISTADAQKKSPTEQAVLLGQFGDWGAYKADPGGKAVCFALSKPTKGETDPPGSAL